MTSNFKFVILTMLIIFITSTKSQGDITVDMWPDGGCRGNVFTNDFTSNECGYWDTNSASALEVVYGSCAMMWQNTQCDGGDSYTFTFPDNLQACDLPCCGWNDNIHSMTACGTWSSDIQCPPGTYGRVLQISQDFLRSGISLHCHEPGLKNPTFSYNTHNKPYNGLSQDCETSARGVYLDYYTDVALFFDAQAKCDYTPIQPPNTAQCGEQEAMVGFATSIEYESEVIKELSIWCTEVPDPSQLCGPSEHLATVASCQNTGGAEMTCKWSQTIGVGQSSSSTETERREETFYAKFGLSIEATFMGLGTSFNTEIGFSNLVGYEWSTEDTTTWHMETTIEASFVVPPGVTSKLEQLTGKCSFYGVNVNFLKKTEIFGNETVDRISYWRLERRLDDAGDSWELVEILNRLDYTPVIPSGHYRRQSNPAVRRVPVLSKGQRLFSLEKPLDGHTRNVTFVQKVNKLRDSSIKYEPNMI